MDQKNLDIYGDAPIDWTRPLGQLKAFEAGPHQSTWLATTRPDGRPHLTGIGAVWLDDRFYFTSGAATQKSRNLAANSACAISVSLPDIDLDGRAGHRPCDARAARRTVPRGWLAGLGAGRCTDRRVQRAERRPASVGRLCSNAYNSLRPGHG